MERLMTEEKQKKLPHFLIRRMREADLPQVMRIERENFSLPWSQKSFLDMLIRPEAVFLVAEAEIILGYAGAVMAADEGNVTNIAVLGTQKQKGIGAALLNALIRETIAAGVRDLFLEVREHNIPALRLYHTAGFREVGRRRNYYDKPAEDALIMKRSAVEV